MTRISRIRPAAIAAVALLALAGCTATQRGSGVEPLAGVPAGSVMSSPLGAPGGAQRPSQPPPEVAGPWTLASGAGGACTMTLVQEPGARAGSVAPRGGCPGQFFATRRWRTTGDSLVLANHRDEVLGTLAQIAPNRFEGSAAEGSSLTLQR